MCITGVHPVASQLIHSPHHRPQPVAENTCAKTSVNYKSGPVYEQSHSVDFSSSEIHLTLQLIEKAMKMELQDPFHLIESPSSILPIASNRLPKACPMYNIILMATKIPGFREHVEFYVVNGDTDPETSWIISIDRREDYGAQISLCIPQTGPYEEAKMLSAFTRTKVIDWREPFMVCSLYGRECEFFAKLQLKVLFNPVLIVPANLYSMDPEVGRQLQLPPIPPNVELKPIDAGAGADYVTQHWHHRQENSIHYMRRAVTHLPSSGVYCDGELVSCAITSMTGFIGMLYTSKSHRGRGFGQLVEMDLIKKLSADDYIPYATVQVLHKDSVRFHETKIEGLELSHRIEFMFHTPEKFND